MFTMFSIFSSKKDGQSVTPFNKNAKEMSPLSPDTVLVRSNPRIPKEEEEKEEGSGFGRDVMYEAKLVVSPVYVSSRVSSSDKALTGKRLLVTKQEVNDLSNLFEDMLLQEQEFNETIKSRSLAKEELKEETVPEVVESLSTEKNKAKLGRCTKTVALSSASEPVEVIRSCRLSK